MDPGQLGQTIVIFIAAVLLRLSIYGGGAWAFHLYLTKSKQTLFRRIQLRPPNSTSIRREILWSASTIVIFSLFSPLIMWAHARSLTRIYLEFSDFGPVYFIASIVGLILAHDFYFYVIHRTIHIPWLYHKIHRIHHLATNPTVFSALSFHPIEAILEGAIVPLAILTVPLHPAALAIWFFWMLATNIEGHCGYDFRAPDFHQRPITGLLGGSHLHNSHHLHFTGNYGLYTTIWDRLFGTFKAPPPPKT
jgi:Delta7-sterol 5-desaturase